MPRRVTGGFGHAEAMIVEAQVARLTAIIYAGTDRDLEVHLADSQPKCLACGSGGAILACDGDVLPVVEHEVPGPRIRSATWRGAWQLDISSGRADGDADPAHTSRPAATGGGGDLTPLAPGTGDADGAVGAGGDCSGGVPQRGQPPRRPRPSKSKRGRLQRTVAAIERKVSRDPDFFYSGRVVLPATLEQDPKLREGVLESLAKAAAKAQPSPPRGAAPRGGAGV